MPSANYKKRSTLKFVDTKVQETSFRSTINDKTFESVTIEMILGVSSNRKTCTYWNGPGYSLLLLLRAIIAWSLGALGEPNYTGETIVLLVGKLL